MTTKTIKKGKKEITITWSDPNPTLGYDYTYEKYIDDVKSLLVKYEGLKHKRRPTHKDITNEIKNALSAENLTPQEVVKFIYEKFIFITSDLKKFPKRGKDGHQSFLYYLAKTGKKVYDQMQVQLELQGLKQQLNDTKAKLSQKEQDNNQLNLDIQSERDAKQQKIGELATLAQEKGSSDIQVKSLQEHVKELQSQLETLKTTHTTEIVALKNNHEEQLTNLNSQNQQQIDKLTSEQQEIKSQHQEAMSKQEAELKCIIENHQTELKSLKDKHTAEINKLSDNLFKANSQLDEEIKKLRMQNTNLTEENQSLHEQINTANSLHETQKQELSEQATKNKELADKIADLTTNFDSVTQENSKLKAQIKHQIEEIKSKNDIISRFIKIFTSFFSKGIIPDADKQESEELLKTARGETPTKKSGSILNFFKKAPDIDTSSAIESTNGKENQEQPAGVSEKKDGEQTVINANFLSKFGFNKGDKKKNTAPAQTSSNNSEQNSIPNNTPG
jgi:myosin heavy subunit